MITIHAQFLWHYFETWGKNANKIWYTIFYCMIWLSFSFFSFLFIPLFYLFRLFVGLRLFVCIFFSFFCCHQFSAFCKWNDLRVWYLFSSFYEYVTIFIVYFVYSFQLVMWMWLSCYNTTGIGITESKVNIYEEKNEKRLLFIHGNNSPIVYCWSYFPFFFSLVLNHKRKCTTNHL